MTQERFAERAAAVARRIGVLVDPQFDPARFRLVEHGVEIDLYNPWHLTGGRADDAQLAELLQPRELGEAGYLGRVDVVRRLIAAGADPNGDDNDGVSVLQRTLAAWVTTDLHVRVVNDLLDAGLVVYRAHIGRVMAEVVGNEHDFAIAMLLESRGRDDEPPLRGTFRKRLTDDDLTPSDADCRRGSRRLAESS